MKLLLKRKLHLAQFYCDKLHKALIERLKTCIQCTQECTYSCCFVFVATRVTFFPFSFYRLFSFVLAYCFRLILLYIFVQFLKCKLIFLTSCIVYYVTSFSVYSFVKNFVQNRCTCLLEIQSSPISECRTDLVSNLVSPPIFCCFSYCRIFSFPLSLSSYLLISVLVIWEKFPYNPNIYYACRVINYVCALLFLKTIATLLGIKYIHW